MGFRISRRASAQVVARHRCIGIEGILCPRRQGLVACSLVLIANVNTSLSAAPFAYIECVCGGGGHRLVPPEQCQIYIVRYQSERLSLGSSSCSVRADTVVPVLSEDPQRCS